SRGLQKVVLSDLATRPGERSVRSFFPPAPIVSSPARGQTGLATRFWRRWRRTRRKVNTIMSTAVATTTQVQGDLQLQRPARAIIGWMSAEEAGQWVAGPGQAI